MASNVSRTASNLKDGAEREGEGRSLISGGSLISGRSLDWRRMAGRGLALIGFGLLWACSGAPDIVADSDGGGAGDARATADAGDWAGDASSLDASDAGVADAVGTDGPPSVGDDAGSDAGGGGGGGGAGGATRVDCAASCEAELDCWDESSVSVQSGSFEAPVHASRLSIQSVSSEDGKVADAWAVHAIDGRPATFWQGALGAGRPEALVLRLDAVRRIRAIMLEVEPSAGSAYQVEVYVSPDASCMGDRVAEAALTGTQSITAPEAVRLPGDGRLGRFVRVVLTSNAGPVRVRELGVLVSAGFFDDLEGPAVPTRRFSQQLEANLPVEESAAVVYSLAGGPLGAEVTANGLLSWTPGPDALPGLYDFEVTATATLATASDAATDDSTTTGHDTPLTVRRTFQLELLSRTVIASQDIDPTVGGQIEIVGSDAAKLDGLVILVPAHAGEHVEIWSLSSSLDEPAPDFRRYAEAFMVVGASAPVTVAVRNTLFERIRREGGEGEGEGEGGGEGGGEGVDDETSSLVLAAYDPPSDHASKKKAVAIVGGSCAEGLDGGAQDHTTILSNALDEGVMAQLMRHEGKCYELKRAPFVVRYWDDQNLSASDVQSRLQNILTAAEKTRSFMNRPGCAPLDGDDVEILIVPLDTGGLAPTTGRLVLINRAFGPEEARVTTYHELTHTIHQRTVLWKNPSAYFDDRSEGRWALEGLAVFNEDEISNTNDWQRRYLNLTDGFPALDKETVEFGLRTSRLIHPYLQFTYFKALKARKHFDVCQFLDRRVQAASAYAAIDALVGGEEVRNTEHAEFVATWLLPALVEKSGRIDDDDLLPDALPEMRDRVIIPDQALPGCGNASSAVEVSLGTVSGGSAIHFVCKVPPDAPLTYRVELVAPKEDATMLVFDAEGNELGALEPEDTFRLPEDTREFSVAVGLHQGTAAMGLGDPKPVRVRVESGEVSFAFQPETDTERPTDAVHPSILEDTQDALRARYFNATTAPEGWLPNGGLYEADYPNGVRVGNLDWRGARGDVLSWKGPHGRSIPNVARSSSQGSPVNLGPNYVTVAGTARAHRGSEVYARGAVLYDFGNAGYVSGAALRYVFDPTTLTERRYLLAVTTRYGESVDRLWSVDLSAPSPVAVSVGTVAVPDGYHFDPERRVNAYFFNSSATRCSTVLPVTASYTAQTREESSRNGSTQGPTTTSNTGTYSSQIVAHVSWATPSQAQVSFEAEVFGASDSTSHGVFAQLGSNPLFSPLEYKSTSTQRMNAAGVPVAIDYDGDQEVRLSASLEYESTVEGFDREDFSMNPGELIHASRQTETTRRVVFSSRSFTATDARHYVHEIDFHQVTPYVSTGSVQENESWNELRLIFADLRTDQFAYLRVETSSELSGSGNLPPSSVPATGQMSRQYKLYFNGNIVASGGGRISTTPSIPIDPASLQAAVFYYDSGISSETRDSETSGAHATVTLGGGAMLGRSGGGPIQLLPEVAVKRRNAVVFSVEFPDFNTYDPSTDLFGLDARAYVKLPNNADAPSILGLTGEDLRLRGLGIF
ncbi:MAG: discoidin domain-containing protein [Deltaproteobacteria bacterium]|nr:discoidin domain-containing protein [Deltaproteobacteria bacterium]